MSSGQILWVWFVRGAKLRRKSATDGRLLPLVMWTISPHSSNSSRRLSSSLDPVPKVLKQISRAKIAASLRRLRVSFRQKNQHFGTLDLIMLVVLCGTVSSVVGASVAGLLHDNRPGRARTTAESLALQIRGQREHSNQTLFLSSSRSPASASPSETVVPPLTDGQIGKDPWGKPYFYSVLGSPSESNPSIVVWSEGPDGRMESDISQLSDQHPEDFKFRGDDVGFVSKALSQ